MTYEEFAGAVATLGIGERATLSELRARYHALARRHHPDTEAGGKDGNPERMQQLNTAYSLLREYCTSYNFNFSEEEFYEQNPEARLRRQFATDPVWGGLKEEDKAP